MTVTGDTLDNRFASGHAMSWRKFFGGEIEFTMRRAADGGVRWASRCII
jgi:hypothetical protein